MNTVYEPAEKDFEIMPISVSQGGDMRSFHYHNSYEIYILEKGNRRYIIDGDVIELENYDVVLIRPYEVHATGGGAYKRHLIYFKRSYLEKFFTFQAIERLLFCFSKKKIHIQKGEFERLKLLMANLNADKNNFIALSEIMEIFNASIQTSPEIIISEKNRRIAEILEYISKNYKAIESLEDIAQNFYITKFHLCRIFKENTGVSVVKYIKMLKIQESCRLLAESNDTIEQIAEKSGFNSSMYFCRSFKEITGQSPTHYRKKAAPSPNPRTNNA